MNCVNNKQYCICKGIPLSFLEDFIERSRVKDYLAGFTVLAAILLVLGMDLFIAMKYGYEYTVSAFMGWLKDEFPIVLLLTGIVLGHLFWPLTLGKK